MVPRRVTLTDDFDAPADVCSRPGCVVDVVEAPEGADVDHASVWVVLSLTVGGTRVERIYDHEFSEGFGF